MVLFLFGEIDLKKLFVNIIIIKQYLYNTYFVNRYIIYNVISVTYPEKITCFLVK